MIWRALALTFIIVASTGMTRAQEGDADAGATVFRKCQACHKVGDGARNGVGPILNDVFGRAAGTVEGYRYSDLNHNAGESGLVWDEDLIFEYLANPQDFLVSFLEDQGKGDLVKGRTKMPFKLADEQQRRDVIAYLMQFSEMPEEGDMAAEGEEAAPAQ